MGQKFDRHGLRQRFDRDATEEGLPNPACNATRPAVLSFRKESYARWVAAREQSPAGATFLEELLTRAPVF